MHRAYRTLLATALLAACATDATAPSDDQLPLQRVAGGVRIVNTTDGPIAYTVLEYDYFSRTLASWGPCPNLDDCTLQPQESAVVPEAEIGGYVPGAAAAVVLWWTVVPDGAGGKQVVEPRSALVPLAAGASAVTATVRFVDVEGGCWALDTDSVRYEPLGLPAEFRVDGSAVQAVIESATDVGTICMVGRLVRILAIAPR
ncbi:MAG: hypothetical protein OER21_02235 [Gemmatimonadota bacterium]|nr:hypothetical protein [Gemmatimonadota bacterium]